MAPKFDINLQNKCLLRVDILQVFCGCVNNFLHVKAMRTSQIIIILEYELSDVFMFFSNLKTTPLLYVKSKPAACVLETMVKEEILSETILHVVGVYFTKNLELRFFRHKR